MGSAATADRSIQKTTDNRDVPALAHSDDDEEEEEDDNKEEDYDDDNDDYYNIVTACCYIGGLAFLFNNPDQWRLPL